MVSRVTGALIGEQEMLEALLSILLIRSFLAVSGAYRRTTTLVLVVVVLVI